MARPTVDPGSWDINLSAGFPSTTNELRISDIPSATEVTARVVLEGVLPFSVHIERIQVFRSHEEIIFPDAQDLPPGMTPEPQTIVREILVAEGDGSNPIRMEPGQHARLRLSIPHVSASFGSGTGELHLLGAGWDPVIVSLAFTEHAVVSTIFHGVPTELHQGGATSFEVELAWLSGPSSGTTYDLIHDAEADRISFEPLHLQVEPTSRARGRLTLHCAEDCPLGRRFLRIEAQGAGSGITLECRILPPTQPPELDPAVKRSLLVERVHAKYLQTGGPKGRLGYPTTPVAVMGNLATRRFNGGRISALLRPSSGDPVVDLTAVPEFEVHVIWRGFRCDRESDSDQLSDTDEPYFVMSIDGITGAVPKMQLFGPFKNIRTGSEVVVNETLVRGMAPTYFRIAARVFEQDFGDPTETAQRLQEKAVEVATEVERIAASAAAASADGPGLGPAAGAGTVSGIFAGPLGALAASAVVAALDLGDDFVGESAFDVYERREERRHAIPRLGKFRDEPFNVRFSIDGGDEGAYTLFFEVLLSVVPVGTTL